MNAEIVAELAFLEREVSRLPERAVLTRASLRRRADILRQELAEEAEQEKMRAGLEEVLEEERANMDFTRE